MLGLLAGGCASAPIIQVGEGPLPAKLQQEETKIFKQVRQEIKLLGEKGALYNDPALEAYLNEIGQQMVPAGRASSEIVYRFRIVRDPTLNAFAFPTGDIFVHTGLLSRLQSEGEVADVLGHEASHVYRRDTLYRFIDMKQKTIAWKISDLLLTPALTVVGAGGITELGLGLVYATSVTGFSRGQEARADLDGLEQLVAAGHDPHEGIWAQERFLAEEEKYRQGPEIFFLASHPNTRWRKEEKEEWLKARGISPHSSHSADVRYMAMTAGLRKENARLNLQMGRCHHALDDLEPISRSGQEDAQTWALIGECYRQMADDPGAVKEELHPKAWKELADVKEEALKVQWRQKALEGYQRAMNLNRQLAEPYQGLGLLLAAQSKQPEAIQNLRRYLELSPQAKDRRFVMSQIERLEKAGNKKEGSL